MNTNWLDRVVTTNCLRVQALMLTVVQTPLLVTPLSFESLAPETREKRDGVQRDRETYMAWICRGRSDLSQI